MMHIFAVLKQWLLQQKETEASKLLEKNVCLKCGKIKMFKMQ